MEKVNIFKNQDLYVSEKRLRNAIPVVDHGSLALRREPLGGDNIIIQIDPGTCFQLDINHWSDGYVFAYLDQLQGWVDGDFVRILY